VVAVVVVVVVGVVVVVVVGFFVYLFFVAKVSVLEHFDLLFLFFKWFVLDTNRMARGWD